jgi:hypothetical protein
VADDAGSDAQRMGPSLECQVCQLRSDLTVADAMTWVMDRDSTGTRWTCPQCAIRSVRAMEAKLDPQWW